MDDLDFWCGEEQEGRAQLLRKLASQVQRHASEVGIAQQLIKIVGEQLKYQTQMVTIHEVTLHAN